MGRGQDAYVYDRTEKVSGERLGDGTHIIYVNGATRSNSDIGKLMHDFLCSNAAEMHFDILKRRVGQFKNSEEGRRYMCEAMERIKDEGIAEGKRKNMLATAKRLLSNGKLMLKEIAKCTGLSLAQVKKLQASM